MIKHSQAIRVTLGIFTGIRPVSVQTESLIETRQICSLCGIDTYVSEYSSLICLVHNLPAKAFFIFKDSEIIFLSEVKIAIKLFHSKRPLKA